MRLPCRRRQAARSQPLSLTVAALIALAPSASTAFQFKPAPSANLDIANLGDVGIAGDFSGISLYEYEGQVGKPLSNNGSESILAPLPNGALASIVSADAAIRAMCLFKNRGVILAGNFTSLDGTKSTVMALLNQTTAQVTPLDGLQGEVNTVYCDEQRNAVYVGGSFMGSNSTNAIAWLGDSGWSNLPFAGFNGPVNTITKASNGHIIFGGSFTGLGNLSTPSQPDRQLINLSGANIVAENHIDRAGFDNPANIACSSGGDAPGSTYLMQSGTKSGFWEAQFDFTFKPTKLRLWNTNVDGRGVKTFRVLFPAQPVDGIANLTYVDPETGRNASCTRECPLLKDASKPQDFHFVNAVGMSRLRIAVSDVYGDGGGLGGVQIYQDKIGTYAINALNEPTCRGLEFPSKATATGPWTESPSLQSDSKYLTVKVDQQSASQASVVFFPSIQESGNYSVNLFTPGCKPDDTCLTRGRVNVTGTMSSGAKQFDFTTSLYQTNNFDKYDQIYFGYVEKTSDGFKPTVTITPQPDDSQQEMTAVAQKVGFTLINSNGGLNGLFDFNPEDPNIQASELETSAINKLGSGFDKMSGVRSIISSDDTLYIGGNFTSKDHKNIVAITGSKDVKSLDGGLNGQVMDLHLEGKKIYAGGEFNNTLDNSAEGLGNVAVYDIDKNTWGPLGAGVNGMVQYVVPLQVNITKNKPEIVIALTGMFSEINKFKDSDVIPTSGFAIWVPSQGNWLQNSPVPVPAYSGTLTASVLGLPANGSLLAGSISSAQLAAHGAAKLDSDGLGPFPVKIKLPAASTTNTRRRSLSEAQLSGVVTGAYYQEDGKNITVLAGHFSAQDANGTTINNLVLIDGKNKDSISGLGEGVSADSSIVTVALKGSVLYAGGKLSGRVNGGAVGGIIAYDIASKTFKAQPAPISGRNGTVSVITVNPKTNDVYVAGSFDNAGGLTCPGVCLYNTDTNQWNRPGTSMEGDVNSMMWASNSKLIAAGDMKGNDTTTLRLAMYDTSSQTWEEFPGNDAIPGPVLLMTPGSSDGKQVWISGKSSKDQSIFLMKYDGDKWLNAPHPLPASTQLRSLQIFTLTKDHDKSDLLSNNQALMLTGSIDLPVVGTVSAALFNGTHYLPYALTTSSRSGAGSIAKIFSQKDDFFASSGGHLALGFVVLIALAIALALILLIVVAGVILDRIRKKRDGYTPAPTSMYDRGSGIQRIPPRELLESLGKTRPSAPHV